MATIPPESPHDLSPGRRNLSAWVQLTALVGFAALAMPFFLGRVYVADDLGEFHLPVRDFYARQLRQGAAFDWMPSLYGGFYLAGEGQLGGYHPLHWALYRWLPLGAAFDLELLLSYPLMFVGTFLFLRRMIGSAVAANFGALAFTFSGFCLLHFVHPNAVAIVAHIPWLLCAIDVALRASMPWQRATAELGVSLLTGSQLLLGYPQYVWLSLLFELAFAVWRVIALRPATERVAWLLAAKLLGFCLGAVQLMPTLDALSTSLRQAPDAAFAETGSLHPLNLVQWLAPYLFRTRVVGQNTHELGLYVGAVPILLCIWLLSRPKQWGRFRPLILFALLFGIGSLLMAAGQFGGLYRLQWWVPLANRFRFPCRAIVLVQFCVAIEAAVAVQLLLESAKEPRRGSSGGRVLAIAFVASVALAIVGPLFWSLYVASWPLVLCGPVLTGIAAALIYHATQGGRWAVGALAALTAVDLCAYGASYAVYSRTVDLHAYVNAIPMPPGAANRRVVALAEASGLRHGDRMLLAGLARVDGYAGLEPKKQLDYSTRAAQQRAGVGWVLGSGADASNGRPSWSPVFPTAPRARLMAQAVDHASGDKALSSVDVSPDAADLELDSPGEARVVEDAPGAIAVATDSETPELLVTTESYHSGWRVMVDGQDAPVLRVDGDFLGCLVDSGRHQVRFRFQPQSLMLGMVLSAGGLGLLLCGFIARLRFLSRASEKISYATPRG